MTKEAGSGPSLPRRQLGRYVRVARESAGMNQGDIAKLMQWSVSTQHRIEKGEFGNLRDRDIELLCTTLEFDAEKSAAMLGLFKQGAEKNWWHSFGDLIPAGFNIYVELEAAAKEMSIYRPDLVPGLLQTDEYARALDRIWFPRDSADEQDRRIELRMSRQKIITRNISPTGVDVVLHEAVLHSIVGDADVMAGQLRHLIKLDERPNVTVRVLPFTAGVPVGVPVGPFIILDFRDGPKSSVVEPRIIYLENFTGDMYLERSEDLDSYRMASEVLQRAALDVVASRNMLRQKVKEYLA